MLFYRTISVAILAGATAVTSLQPAAAAPLMMNPGNTQSAASNIETVQYRRHGGHGWRHHHRHGWRRGYHGHGYYGNGAAVLGGLAAGAIIGGAIANSQAQARGGDAVAYCSQRFKSYDPASGTYMGYDGNRHACP